MDPRGGRHRPTTRVLGRLRALLLRTRVTLEARMSFLSGRMPFMLCVPFLIAHCTADPAPVGSPETSTGEPPEMESETLAPTTGPSEPDLTETGAESAGPDDGSSGDGSDSSSSSGEV